MIIYNILTTANYASQRFAVINDVESAELSPYVDSVGIPSIGVGFNLREEPVFNAVIADILPMLNAVQRNALMEVMEIEYEPNDDSALIGNLNAKMAVFHAENNAIPAVFSYSSANEVRATFDRLAPSFESDLNRHLGAVSVPRSQERVVLFSLFWNQPGLIGPNLIRALSEGNRAEAWYEIRHNSNGGTSQSIGIAKRRFYESHLFGLYNNVNSVTESEAFNVGRMYARHQSRILQYEGNFQEGLTRARNDFGVNVQTLEQSFQPAITVLRTLYNVPESIELHRLLIGDVGAENTLAALDSQNGLNNNLIIGGDSNDALAGNLGNDILIGGTGSNGYYFAGAWGHDRVIDGSGGNSFLFINGMRLGGLANRISNPQAMGLPAESFVLHRPADNSVWAVMRMGSEVARRRQDFAGNQPPRVFELDDDATEVPPALSRRQAAAAGPANASITELGDYGSSVIIHGFETGKFAINISGDNIFTQVPAAITVNSSINMSGAVEYTCHPAPTQCRVEGTDEDDVINLSRNASGGSFVETVVRTGAGDDVINIDVTYTSLHIDAGEGNDIVIVGQASYQYANVFLVGGPGRDVFVLKGAVSPGNVGYSFLDYNPREGDVIDLSAFPHIRSVDDFDGPNIQTSDSGLMRIIQSSNPRVTMFNVTFNGPENYVFNSTITQESSRLVSETPANIHLIPNEEGTVTNAPGDSILYGSVGVNNFVVIPHEDSSVSILGMNERENDQIDLSAYDDWISSFADLEIDDFGTLTRRQGRDRDIYPNRHDARRDPEGDGQVWSRRQLFSNDSFGNCSVFDMNCTYNNQTQIPLQRIFLPGNGTNNTNMSVDVLNAALLTASSFIGNANVTALLPVAPVQPENPDDEAGKIAGGVVGGVLGVAFLAFCCWGGVKLYNRFRRPQAAEAAENEPYNHPPPHEGQEPRIYGADVPDADAVAAAAEQPGTVHHHRPPPNIDPAAPAAQASWQHRTQQRAMQQVM